MSNDIITVFNKKAIVKQPKSDVLKINVTAV